MDGDLLLLYQRGPAHPRAYSLASEDRDGSVVRRVPGLQVRKEKDVVKTINVGDVFEVAHPFVREKYGSLDDEGWSEAECWRPGIRWVDNGPEDQTSECDGSGTQILTVVSIHKPGTYPERVFYTRRWRSPGGKEFGKRKLWVKAKSAFSAMLGGYRYRVVMKEQAHG